MNYHPSIQLKETVFGKSIFTSSDLRPGTFLIEMTGQTFRLEDIPPLSERQIMDHYIQCSDDLFLGPSGLFDDYFNHSCDPNAGLFFNNGRILVKTIKRVPANTEICFDYSTVMTIDPLVMQCSCRSKLCRGEVLHFRTLPERTRNRYIALGIVPQFSIASCAVSNKKVSQKISLFQPTLVTA